MMTGDEIAKKLLAIRPDMPISLCTVFSERIAEDKVRAVGSKDFVVKPVLMSEIDKIIRSCCIKK